MARFELPERGNREMLLEIDPQGSYGLCKRIAAFFSPGRAPAGSASESGCFQPPLLFFHQGRCFTAKWLTARFFSQAGGTVAKSVRRAV
jgi:hypothetical protein